LNYSFDAVSQLFAQKYKEAYASLYFTSGTTINEKIIIIRKGKRGLVPFSILFRYIIRYEA
ncbi:MAG TPA: hypothetical protein DCG38_09945, partial [Eubacteriaceae bacterium]|nr:hypothetical protein [Eubacteriaceae bacterium]